MTDNLKAQLQESGIVLQSAEDFDLDTPVSFSISLDGLEGSGKTHFIMYTMPRPLIIVNFGDRSALQFLYKMTEEERKDVYTYDIQPSTPEGWTFKEAVQSLVTLNTLILNAAPLIQGGTFALDGGSSWWSVMQQVFVEPKEQARIQAGIKKTGGVVYEEANNRVRGVLGHVKANGCFLVLTHQMKQDWGSDGPIPGKFSPKKNSQIPYLMEVQLTMLKLCTTCNGYACETDGHVGRKHMTRVTKLSGNTALEGLVIKDLDFPKLYRMQTGKAYVAYADSVLDGPDTHSNADSPGNDVTL